MALYKKIAYSLLGLILIVFTLPAFSCAREDPTDFDRLREKMVDTQIVARGITDPDVVAAMKKVPRHRFVPEKSRASSYNDHPLPIGEGQTISQPYIVAFMTDALDLTPRDRVLEIGTGSGYQAAVLAELAGTVYTIEIVESLGKRAKKTLKELGYDNVHVRIGDGYKGWPQQAPFDAVMVTCAPEEIPQPLVDQLKEGGRMIIPVGRVYGVQKLIKCVKRGGQLNTEEVMMVRFVPMVEEK